MLIKLGTKDGVPVWCNALAVEGIQRTAGGLIRVTTATNVYVIDITSNDTDQINELADTIEIYTRK